MYSPATLSKPQGGFTLIEILIAIALLGLIASMVFGSLMTTNHAVEVGRDASSREQTIRRVLRLMAEDLSLSRQDGALPWVGTNGWQEGQPADTVAFLAMNDGSSGPAARAFITTSITLAARGTTNGSIPCRCQKSGSR